MGYYKNEDATRDTIDSEGYLKSGDLGCIIEGNLVITGRAKEIIITSGGENIAPLNIEDAIKEKLSIISNATVIGE